VVFPEQEIRQYLSKISRIDHSAYDAFVLVLLTHGNQDGVFGTDASTKDGNETGFILIDEITSMFDSSKCHSLSGKPKMFFIQACQGGKDSSSVLHNAFCFLW